MVQWWGAVVVMALRVVRAGRERKHRAAVLWMTRGCPQCRDRGRAARARGERCARRPAGRPTPRAGPHRAGRSGRYRRRARARRPAHPAACSQLRRSAGSSGTGPTASRVHCRHCSAISAPGWWRRSSGASAYVDKHVRPFIGKMKVSALDAEILDSLRAPLNRATYRVTAVHPDGALTVTSTTTRATRDAMTPRDGRPAVAFPLVRVVETRGIEPLTPALQTCGGLSCAAVIAGQSDPRAVCGVCRAHRRRGFGDRVGDSLSIVACVAGRPTRACSSTSATGGPRQPDASAERRGR